MTQLPIVDNPALGIFFDKPNTEPRALGDKSNMDINLMFTAGQFSDSPAHHEHDAKALFHYAHAKTVAVVAGTEGSHNPRNNFSQMLAKYAKVYDFDLYSNPHGEWLASNRAFGKMSGSGFIPVIPAEGKTPGQPAHDVRGVAHITVVPKDSRIGVVSVTASHWLTQGTDLNTPRGKQNLQLEQAIGAYAKQAGSGNSIVFTTGDTNLDDKHRNAYTGVPLKSCWDELGKYPITHPHPNGTGPTLDQIASYNHDGRVKCKNAHAITDAELHLYSDHFGVFATYSVAPLKGN